MEWLSIPTPHIQVVHGNILDVKFWVCNFNYSIWVTHFWLFSFGNWVLAIQFWLIYFSINFDITKLLMKSIKHESQILFRPALGVRSTQTLVKIYNKRYLVKLFAQVYSQVNKLSGN